MLPAPFNAALPLLLAFSLAGCASVDAGAPLADVNRLTQPHTGQPLADQPLAAEALAERLREPLSADAAVQLALQNNLALQARLARLGVTAVEVADAGRLPNPGFRFSRLTRGSEVELERGWHVDLARLLTLPLVRAASMTCWR